MADVKRTSMNLDRDLVREAADALGTEGATATVHAAMREVLDVRLRVGLVDGIIDGTIPVPTSEELEEMRRPHGPW